MRHLLLTLLVVVMPVGAADLPAGVERILTLREVPPASASFFVVELDNGEILLDWLSDEPRNPASTMKLLTTLVALDELGPAYRWRTEVYALGTIEDGVLDGDLLLKGYGDPFLVTDRVWQLTREIRRAGVHHVTGDLVLDDSWFDVIDYDPAAFDNQPLRAYNVGPNALLMNLKVVRYWFEPEGDGVAVQLDPPLDNLLIDNRLRTRPGACRGFQRGIAVSMNDTLDEVTFSGRFPAGCKRYAMDRTVLDANRYAYGLFRALWEESGGHLGGSWRRAIAPEDVEPLVTFRSLPLQDVIERVNKHSNNVMARQLLYTLAAERRGEPGTEAAGLEVVSDWLRRHGLGNCCTAMQNGSGLSRAARITATDLAWLLQFAWQRPYMPEFVSSLSLAGYDGTLRRRFDYRGLDGQAHMKSGRLDHVSALAGYLQSRSGRRFAVVSIVNHDDVHRGPGDELHEALLRWVYER